MTSSVTAVNKINILKKYSNEFLISIDKNLWNEIYCDYLEKQEIEENKEDLIEKYEQSLESGFGMKI